MTLLVVIEDRPMGNTAIMGHSFHSEILGKHLIWWKDPRNVLIGGLLHIEEHSFLLFTIARFNGW